MADLVRSEYGRIIAGDGDGGRSYTLTRDDLLWLGRSFTGEAGNLGRQEYIALCWCYAQRMMAFERYRTWSRGEYETKFVKLVRLHSQPVNPNWMEGGRFCIPGGRGHGQDRCSPEALARRARFSSLPWGSIRLEIRQAIIDWAEGRANNPIPKYIDFAGRSAEVSDIFIDPLQVTPRGNKFYKQRGHASLSWPENYVRILFEQNRTSEDPAPQAPNEEPHSSQTTTEGSGNREENETTVRENEITSNRTTAPRQSYGYFVLDSSGSVDPATNNTLNQEASESKIQSRYDRFYDQVEALRNVTTLDMAQSVPVLAISTEDEDGEIVELNDLVFGTTPIEHYQQNQEEKLPFRPIASIEMMSIKVESPSVGGVTGISTATLSIKVHNPELISSNHPRGKFIAWMMRQGFAMRIRYGISGPSFRESNSRSTILREAFQTREEDFYVAQHDVSINDDKTYQLKLTLMPSIHKLMNKMQIGESIPFSDISNGGSALTESDIDNILDNLNAGGAEQEQSNEIKRRIYAFRDSFNAGRPSPGYRLVQNEEGEGIITFGSVLHGAIGQSRILDADDGANPVPIENMVNALKSVQSIVLSRRIRQILEEDSYRHRFGDIAESVVVNLGPLMYRLVFPEVEQIIRYASQNNLSAGETFSSDFTPERRDGEQETKRTRVRLIFGNFNPRAGQWADKPISAIPVNTTPIFTHLRRQREVGQFSSTINAFMATINNILSEAANFRIQRQTPNETEGRVEWPIERPTIKYAIYPDRDDPSYWIMYVYDHKSELVKFRQLTGELSQGGRIEAASRDEIVQRLNQLGIPWIEMGEEGSIIKQMSAHTQADDLILAHNMIQSNSDAITSRDLDGNLNAPVGISREFIQGAQRTINQVINAQTVVLPIETTLTTYMLATGFLFAPIYVFFPTKMFEGLYLVHILEHEIKNGSAQTRMTLQINMTTRNRLSQ